MFSLLLLIFTIPVFSQNADKNHEALKKAVDNMTTAQANYDAGALDRLFTDDFIEVSPAGEFDPRAKVISFYGSESKAKAGGVQIKIEEDFKSIRVYGNTAVVIAELSYFITQQGKTMPPRKMMITIVGRKSKGNWKIASAQYTGVRPPPPPAPASPNKP